MMVKSMLEVFQKGTKGIPTFIAVFPIGFFSEFYLGMGSFQNVSPIESAEWTNSRNLNFPSDQLNDVLHTRRDIFGERTHLSLTNRKNSRIDFSTTSSFYVMKKTFKWSVSGSGHLLNFVWIVHLLLTI